MISFKVFMSFVDEDGNATRLQSKECYNTWVLTRRSPPKQPEESFRRVLTAHVCGVDGRRPFEPHVEASLLKVLRKKEIWECFRGTGVSIGIRGFRNQGFHEARAKNGTTAVKKSRSRKRDLKELAHQKKSRAEGRKADEDILASQQRVIQQQLAHMQLMQERLMMQTSMNTPTYHQPTFINTPMPAYAGQHHHQMMQPGMLQSAVYHTIAPPHPGMSQMPAPMQTITIANGPVEVQPHGAGQLPVAKYTVSQGGYDPYYTTAHMAQFPAPGGPPAKQ